MLPIAGVTKSLIVGALVNNHEKHKGHERESNSNQNSQDRILSSLKHRFPFQFDSMISPHLFFRDFRVFRGSQGTEGYSDID